MAQIALEFSASLPAVQSAPFQLGLNPKLEYVEFQHPQLEAVRCSFRGKGFADPALHHTFLWSPAVRAACLLLLRTKAHSLEHMTWPVRPLVALTGGAGSPAASLDYALSKKPLWLLDTFGVNSGGHAIAQNLFMRWNPERKRGGDVFVALNPTQLCRDSITVRFGMKELDPQECAELAELVEFETRAGTQAANASLAIPSPRSPGRKVSIAA